MKTTTTVFIDGEIKEMAKRKGLNISQVCETALAIEVNIADVKEDRQKALISEQQRKITEILKLLTDKDKQLKACESERKQLQARINKPQSLKELGYKEMPGF